MLWMMHPAFWKGCGLNMGDFFFSAVGGIFLGCPVLCFFPRCGQVTFDAFHMLRSFMINRGCFKSRSFSEISFMIKNSSTRGCNLEKF